MHRGGIVDPSDYDPPNVDDAYDAQCEDRTEERQRQEQLAGGGAEVVKEAEPDGEYAEWLVAMADVGCWLKDPRPTFTKRALRAGADALRESARLRSERDDPRGGGPVSGYDVEKLEALLAQATETNTLLNEKLVVAAVNALPAMLHDLKLLAAARDSGVLKRAANALQMVADEYADDPGSELPDGYQAAPGEWEGWNDDTVRDLKGDAAALRTLAAPPTEEEK